MDIIEASWREGARKQYATYIRQWTEFCELHGLNKFQADVKSVIEFLTEQFCVRNLRYSAMNTARSALSSFVVLNNTLHTISTHPILKRFMRGVFNKRPPQARYKQVWDVRIVLNYLRNICPARSLDLKSLTLKLYVNYFSYRTKNTNNPKVEN